MASEAKFKAWFREQWPGWLESYEPRQGGGIGIPDVQILVPLSAVGVRVLLPVELKIGVCRSRRVFPTEMRAAQISWHRRLANAGGVSAAVIGVPSETGKSWFPFLIDGRAMCDWREGYAFESGVDLTNEPGKMLEMTKIWFGERI